MGVADFMDEAVSVVTRTWSGEDGVRQASTTSTSFHASVQDMKPSRQAIHGIDSGSIGYTVYFASDPGCTTGDLIVWGTRSLAVLGPVQATRRNAAYMVECREVVG